MKAKLKFGFINVFLYAKDFMRAQNRLLFLRRKTKVHFCSLVFISFLCLWGLNIFFWKKKNKSAFLFVFISFLCSSSGKRRNEIERPIWISISFNWLYYFLELKICFNLFKDLTTRFHSFVLKQLHKLYFLLFSCLATPWSEVTGYVGKGVIRYENDFRFNIISSGQCLVIFFSKWSLSFVTATLEYEDFD